MFLCVLFGISVFSLTQVFGEINSVDLIEQDEYIESFIRSLPKYSAAQVSYKNGQLTINNTPWDSSMHDIGLFLGAFGLCCFPFGLGAKRGGVLAIGIAAALIGGTFILLGKDPGDWILAFDDQGLLFNGKRCATWSQIDDMAINTLTICNEYGQTSSTTTMKVLDRFRNPLLILSDHCPIGVSLNNVIALIKHYRKKATNQPLIAAENSATVQKPSSRTIYIPQKD